MTDVRLRLATLEDAQPISTLSGELGYPTSRTEAAERLVALLGDEQHAVFVACAAEEAVVGWIHVFEATRIEYGVFAELGGLVVATASRGSGVGRALLERAEGWARDRGVEKMRVRTRSDRSGAHSFYEGLGYALNKSQRVYDKHLG